MEGWIFLISEVIVVISFDVLEENFVIFKGVLGIRLYLFIDKLFEVYFKGIIVKDIRVSVNFWWGEFWKEYFNCLWYFGLKDVCNGEVKVDECVFFKIYNVFIFYFIDVIFVLVYVIDFMFKCKELRGLLEDGKCGLYINFIIKFEDILLYL